MGKKITSILSLAAFILFCYCVFMLAMPHYMAWKLESDTRDIVRFNVQDEYEMKGRIIKHAREMNIPVQENSVIVTRTYEGEYKARVSWIEQVDLFGYYQRTYEFQFEVGGKELGKR